MDPSPIFDRRMLPVFPRLLMIATLLLVGSNGCVSRRLTIRSNPPGAIVEVNGKQIGVTPASMDFTYYGTYEIRLTHPGYETKTIYQPIAPPWYQVPPLDVISDNVLPFRATNRHDFTYTLTPLGPESNDDSLLRNRGEDFRTRARTGT